MAPKKAKGKSNATSTAECDRPVYLRPLSDAQYRAATYNPAGSLIVSSAPGSGKTRILVARVAWLINHCNIKPEDCIVVTFTNKAAKEMRSRLAALIGPELTNKVVLGTFHSTCVRYLRKYGSLINLANSFKIVDIDDVKKILKGVIAELGAEMDEAGIDGMKPETCLNEISSAKSKMLSPEQYQILGQAQTSVKAPPSSGGSQPSQGFLKRYSSVLALVYQAYEDKLKEMEALDFDDLLVWGSRLLKGFPNVVSNVQHAKRAVTVVGDPDQSIYGWRFAEIGNLATLKIDFPGTEEIKLEQTYRSSAAIVEASLAVVKQDEDRVDKGLFTAHERGLPVVLNKSGDQTQEAFFVASEIKRVIAEHGGMVSYKDFAVLLRANAASRSIEQELTKLSIPSRMLGGHKFFDRKEIKDILAYLTLVDNPSYVMAFTQIINVPKRGVGEKMLKEYFELAEKLNKKPMGLAEEIVFGKLGPIRGGTVKPTMKRALESVLKILTSCRSLAKQGKDVGFLIDKIMDATDYKSHLNKDASTSESRLQNIQELKSFAATVAGSGANLSELPDLNDDGAAQPQARGAFDQQVVAEEGQAQPDENKSSTRRSSRKRGRAVLDEEPDSDLKDEEQIAGTEAEFANGGEDEEMDEWDGIDAEDPEGEDDSPPRKLARKKTKKDSANSASLSPSPRLESDGDEESKTPLRQFLESCTLSTDLESEEEGADNKVTISTIHSAKGLEWPVVFMIGIESGTFPSFRSTEASQISEDRRLLYVGMTRSQGLLYLTYTHRRLIAGRYKDTVLSDFITGIKPSEVQWWDNGGPRIEEKDRRAMATILERIPVSEEVVKQAVDAFNASDVMSKAPAVNEPSNRWGSSSSGGWGAPSSSPSYWNNSQSSTSGFDRRSQTFPGQTQTAEKASVGSFYSSFSRPKLSDFPTSTSFNNAKTPRTSFNNAKGNRWNPHSANVNEEKVEIKPLKSAPSFTNQYRLESKSQDLNSNPSYDDEGASSSRRPAADLKSFQKKSQDSVSLLMDMLPPEQSEAQAEKPKASGSKKTADAKKAEPEAVGEAGSGRGRGGPRGRPRGRGAKAASTGTRGKAKKT